MRLSIRDLHDFNPSALTEFTEQTLAFALGPRALRVDLAQVEISSNRVERSQVRCRLTLQLAEDEQVVTEGEGAHPFLAIEDASDHAGAQMQARARYREAAAPAP